MSRLGLCWLATALSTVAESAQPVIDHSQLRCMKPGEFAVVLTGIEPLDVQTAKVYFRSSLYRDFYYVEMRYQNGEYVGILPQPSSDTPSVVYYLEALDSSFETARSLEYDADVEDRCRQEPAAAYFPGADPGITVGATSAGASPLPPGFAAAGIVGTITAAGITSGLGGGFGAGAAIGIGAAAAGAAGAAVLTTGGTETATSIAMGVTTTSATSGPGTGGGGSTTSTSTGGGSGDPTVPTTTTTSIGSEGGSTTTTSTGSGSTTTTTGSGSTTTTTSAASTTTTPATTTPATTTSITGVLDASCFTVTSAGACGVQLDGTCVAKPVDQYEWVLDLTSRWRRINVDGPDVVSHTWTEDECEDDGEVLRFRLKVRRGSETSTVIKDFRVTGDDLREISTERKTVRVTTQLVVEGAGRGHVLIDGEPVRMVDNRAPVALRVMTTGGTHRLEGVLTSGSGLPGTWRFDLPDIVPGSVRVRAGNVVGVEPTGVLFRLSGRSGERLELTFELRE